MDINYNILVPLSWLKPLILNLSLVNFWFPRNEFLFILEFLGKILLVFAVGGIIGKFLKLDKVYDDSEPNKKSYKSSELHTETKKSDMSKMFISIAVIPLLERNASHNAGTYLIGAVIALLIMCYLVYTLIRPEKF